MRSFPVLSYLTQGTSEHRLLVITANDFCTIDPNTGDITLFYPLTSITSISTDKRSDNVFRLLLADLPPRLFASEARADVISAFMANMAVLKCATAIDANTHAGFTRLEHLQEWRGAALPSDDIRINIEEVSGSSYIPQIITFRGDAVITSSYTDATPVTRDYTLVEDVVAHPHDARIMSIVFGDGTYTLRVSEQIRDNLFTVLIGRVRLHKYSLNRIVAMHFPHGDHETRPARTDPNAWQPPAPTGQPRGYFTASRPEPEPTIQEAVVDTDDDDAPPTRKPTQLTGDGPQDPLDGTTGARAQLGLDIRAALETGDTLRKCVARRGVLHTRFFRLVPRGGLGIDGIALQWGVSQNDKNWRQVRLTSAEGGPASATEAKTITKAKAPPSLAFHVTGTIVVLTKTMVQDEKDTTITLLAPDKPTYDKWLNGLQVLLSG